MTFEEMLAVYDGFLIDAYGVLVDGAGLRPGADDFLRWLAKSHPFAIVTNDSSRLPLTISEQWAKVGLVVDHTQVVTSGVVLEEHLRKHHAGARAHVLGTPDAFEYVRRAGVQIVSWEDDFDVFVLADEMGFDFLPACNRALSGLIRQVRIGRTIEMLLPNPDVIYPADARSFGFAAGGVAAMFERALGDLFADQSPTFVRLGKPHPSIFWEGARRIGASRPLVIGDQLTTDIAGAHAAGFESALVLSGVPPAASTTVVPTWRWDDLPTR